MTTSTDPRGSAKIRLQRATINFSGIDITFKTSKGLAREFAPDAAWSLGHKNHTLIAQGQAPKYRDCPPIDDAEYTRLYLDRLVNVSADAWRWLRDTARADKNFLCVLCYCRDGCFCHTHLLIHYMLKRWPDKFEDARTSKPPMVKAPVVEKPNLFTESVPEFYRSVCKKFDYMVESDGLISDEIVGAWLILRPGENGAYHLLYGSHSVEQEEILSIVDGVGIMARGRSCNPDGGLGNIFCALWDRYRPSEISVQAKIVAPVVVEPVEVPRGMRVGVVGSRGFYDYTMFSAKLTKVWERYPGAVLVTGTDWESETGRRPMRGADQMAAHWAKTNNKPYKIWPADWNKYPRGKGNPAGFERNTQIAEDSDIVIAFWDELSDGTRDTLNKALAMGKPCYVITFDGGKYRYSTPTVRGSSPKSLPVVSGPAANRPVATSDRRPAPPMPERKLGC